MNPKNYFVQLDQKQGVLNRQTIQFTTGDNGMCELQIRLLVDKTTPVDLTGCVVRLTTKIDDDVPNMQDCEIVSAEDGLVKINLMQSMFSKSGEYYVDTQVYDSSNETLRLTYPRFMYYVTSSLFDDNTVQADPQFSILQDMIVKVSNADTVSAEALEIANEAKAIADTQVPTINKAAANAQEALQRAESVVTQSELNGIIQLVDSIPPDTTRGLFLVRKVI